MTATYTTSAAPSEALLLAALSADNGSTRLKAALTIGTWPARAMASKDQAVQAHANATEKLLRDPDAGLQFAVDQVKRIFAKEETLPGLGNRV